MTKSRGILPPRIPWTDVEIEILRRDYPSMPAKQVAAALGRPLTGVYRMASKLGLVKSIEFLASDQSGRTSATNARGLSQRFRKGQGGWNKGMKGLQIGGKETQFKRGQMPHNHLPVGSRVISSDGYLMEKLAEPRTWGFVHVMTWEAVNGKRPPGHLLRFKDGNPLNCAIENLECISRQEHMRRTTIHRYPKEVRHVIRLTRKLQRTIARMEDEKQD